MKNKLLGVFYPQYINIGDYIQALASSQFYPNIDGFIQREGLKEYEGEESKIIMNGWYMHDSIHWPPSNQIYPLFVAFHINSTMKDGILSEEGITYLKQHEPIGCRDLYTRDLLISKGVDAYFSGCMTLTLGYSYKNDNHEGGIYFVDPYIEVHHKISYYLPKLFYFLKKINKISKISIRWFGRISIKGLIKGMIFLESYSKIFSEDDLMNAKYICQQASGQYWPKTDEELLKLAEDLVKQYAQASLVVTSRIHCALPCLGLETPVLFTKSKNTPEFSSCRFGGLLELFNIIEWDNGNTTYNFPNEGKLSVKNHPINKEGWKDLANGLIQTCQRFFK